MRLLLGLLLGAALEARNRPELGRDGAHASAFAGRKRPLFSAGCGILEGGGGGASTAARLSSPSGIGFPASARAPHARARSAAA
jgi:hypothetical protein